MQASLAKSSIEEGLAQLRQLRRLQQLPELAQASTVAQLATAVTPAAQAAAATAVSAGQAAASTVASAAQAAVSAAKVAGSVNMPLEQAAAVAVSAITAANLPSQLGQVTTGLATLGQGMDETTENAKEGVLAGASQLATLDPLVAIGKLVQAASLSTAVKEVVGKQQLAAALDVLPTLGTLGSGMLNALSTLRRLGPLVGLGQLAAAGPFALSASLQAQAAMLVGSARQGIEAALQVGLVVRPFLKKAPWSEKHKSRQSSQCLL